jgi:hypothetical protein
VNAVTAEEPRALPDPVDVRTGSGGEGEARPKRYVRDGIFLAVVLILAVAVVGIRLAVTTRGTTKAPASLGTLAVPESPAIEAAWGLRFTAVIMLADNGGVELRYQVIDQAKAEKIHLGDATSNQLPTIEVEGTSHKVTPSSVLMHFHHGDMTNGATYSIVYGNAGGVVRAGVHVSIVMKDGTKLVHALVID